MAQKKYVSLTRLSDFLDNIKAKYSQIGHKHTLSDITDYKSITVDASLSSTSTNPVQNKVIDAEFEAISTAMNALDLAIDGKADTSHNHDSVYDAKGSAATAESNAIAYTDTSVGELGDGFSNVIFQMYGNDLTEDGAPTIRGIANDEANVALASAKAYTNSVVSGKADASHTHDDRYYTESEIDTKLSKKADSSHNHDSEYDAKGSASDALDSAIAYTDSSVGELGSGLETVVLAMYGSDFKDEGVPTIRQIANDEANAALESAKTYTDIKTSGMATTTVVDNKISSHNTSTSAHSDIRDLISGLTTRLNTLANSDDTTLDQMSEVVAYIKNNKSLIDGITTSKVNVADIVNNLTTNATNKPLSASQGVAIKALIDALQSELDSHTHAIADVSGLQSALDGKAASSHGTHVSYSSTVPVMDGTASAGSASTVARSDHKHPTDTSRASKTEFDTHNSDTTKHITSTERTNWNAAHTHSQAAHAPSNAEKNQNAFSNIAVSGQTTVAADTATDTVTFVGSNVTITTDATNDKVTFAVADGSTSAKGLVQLTNSTSSTSTTTAATPNSVKSAYDLANTAKTNAATAQARADSAYSLADGKLNKTTYEYNAELALGSTGKVCIGKFPMYDSNISVEIKSTTNTTYNGTLIIATQNINTSGGGSYTATVYGDANNSLTDSIKIHYGSGSNVFSVYINLPSWSKNLLHIQCVSLKSAPTDIATTVSEIPSNATIAPVNALKAQFDAKVPTSRTINNKALSANISLTASDVSAYSKTEIDAMNFITISDIDAICGGSI